jgi:UDP-N-acetylglucosamine--N-acetylmuramyl-(pentapeptide) pyrophosphoryl-undecaprenol N-acetylglucosamine transferase
MSGKCALVMAGGTGGHIFPGLAVAQALQQQGWRVHWLGGRGSPGSPAWKASWCHSMVFRWR